MASREPAAIDRAPSPGAGVLGNDDSVSLRGRAIALINSREEATMHQPRESRGTLTGQFASPAATGICKPLTAVDGSSTHPAPVAVRGAQSSVIATGMADSSSDRSRSCEAGDTVANLAGGFVDRTEETCRVAPAKRGVSAVELAWECRRRDAAAMARGESHTQRIGAKEAAMCADNAGERPATSEPTPEQRDAGAYQQCFVPRNEPSCKLLCGARLFVGSLRGCRQLPHHPDRASLACVARGGIPPHGPPKHHNSDYAYHHNPTPHASQARARRLPGRS